ncbi:MAG: pantetheine-phosphate adenylyltransferase [Candidatus Nanohalobium sp.]
MSVYSASEEDREKLREPRGDLVQEEELIEELESRDYERVIAVGDRVSRDIARSKVNADLYITDGRVEREETEKGLEIDAQREFNAENPAGEITKEAWKATRKASALRCITHLHVDGEEDLLALTATIFAPENSVIVYGLWDRGAVLMEPDKENREFCRELVDLDSAEHLIVGGSWDHFHSGHRYILEAAAERGKKIDVGISSDEMLREKLGHKPTHSFEQRKGNVEDFLESLGVEDFRTIELNGIYGNAVEEGDVLIVTPETEKNGRKINAKREELGKDKLELEVIKKLEAFDGEVISSTRIRNNEIDENGLEP